MKKLIKIAAVFFLVLLHSCMDDDRWYDFNPINVRTDTSIDNYLNNQRGLFIVNEGNFMYDNASVSFYMIDSMKVLNNVFFRTNELPLGDVAQSMIIRDTLAYIVVNNSGKVFVMNTETFEMEGAITGLVSPRHMHIIDNSKSYITDLYASSVSIADPAKLKITGSINVSNNSRLLQHSTEMLIEHDNYIFINCWSYDEMVLVIDSETNQLVDSIKVPRQPNSMVKDKYDRIWVLSDGGYTGSPQGKDIPGLTLIDPDTREVKRIYHFNSDDSPRGLEINGRGDTLYFINNHVFRQAVEDEFDPELFISSPYDKSYTGGYYAIGVDPVSSEVYVSDAIDNVQRGIVYRCMADGMPVDTFRSGIIPGYFCFKPALK